MKDKKAFIIYILLSIVLWQFLLSVESIITKGAFKIDDALVFTIEPVYNTGGAFGIFGNYPLIFQIFGIGAIIAIILYCFFKLEFHQKRKILLLSTLSAGILGNTIQRILQGFVFDYIKLSFIDFPTFNLFDVIIVSSLFLILIHTIRNGK